MSISIIFLEIDPVLRPKVESVAIKELLNFLLVKIHF